MSHDPANLEVISRLRQQHRHRPLDEWIQALEELKELINEEISAAEDTAALEHTDRE